MDADSWSARLSSAAKRYQLSLQSRSDMFMGFEEIDGDDDVREEFPCPFCSEYFDIVGLCCHIDEEHPVDAQSGVCPICVMRVGVDMVAHITIHHGNVFKDQLRETSLIYVLSLTSGYVQRKRKSCKSGSHSMLSLLRRELREGTLQSLYGGSSCIVSSSSAAPDPLLSSFILPMTNDLSSTPSQRPSETSSAKKLLDEKVIERDVQRTPLSVMDKEKRAQRCEFVHGLLLSTILGEDL